MKHAMFRRPTDLKQTDLPTQHRQPGADWTAIETLIALCNSGRLYEVEQWIAEGHPIQCAPPSDRKLRRRHTPLQIAVSKGFHSLAAVLLANGYNPNGDYCGCLEIAVRSRDRDMVELLLKFGADPNACDIEEVLLTYDRPIMDRFIEAGVDPCAGNATARALLGKARPMLGFVKTHWERIPGLRHQVETALHVFARENDEKGVALMLWLGANPYAITPATASPEDVNELSHCAMESALWCSRISIRRQLMRKPIPADMVRPLMRAVACNPCPDVVRFLLAAGADPNTTEDEDGSTVLEHFVTSIAWRFGNHEPNQDALELEALELMLAAGAKMHPPQRRLAQLRRSLLDGYPAKIRKAIELLGRYEAMSASELHELTRTPTMRRLLSGQSKTGSKTSVDLMADNHSSKISAQASGPGGYWKNRWYLR